MSKRNKNTRTLVTGGAGFIGSHLVEELLRRGDAVTVLDDFSTGFRGNLAAAHWLGDLQVIEGSVLDREVLAVAMADVEIVYHLAVQCVRRSIGRPMENHEINATGALNALEAARQAGVARFVYCSSSEVYGSCGDEWLNEETSVPAPTTVYGAAKLVGEHYTHAYMKTYGMETIVVRPFNAFGPREHCVGDLAEVIPRFAIRILNGERPVVFGDGEQTRDFTYVEDIARGLADAGNKKELAGNTVNIAFGRGRSVNEIAEALLRICQRTDLEPILSEPRPGDIQHLQADVTLAHELLGFHPNVSFEDGLDAFLQWFHTRYPDASVLKDEPEHNWTVKTS